MNKPTNKRAIQFRYICDYDSSPLSIVRHTTDSETIDGVFDAFVFFLKGIGFHDETIKSGLFSSWYELADEEDKKEVFGNE